jgi:hypothetical protein
LELTAVTTKSTSRREAYPQRPAVLELTSHSGDYEKYITP